MPLTQADARENLKKLLDKYYTLNQVSNLPEKRAMSESSVVRQFIDILLRDVLGWPIEDPARYRYELVTDAGRPDMTLTPEKGGVIFVEAKKFGIIKPLQTHAATVLTRALTPTQMALPGMSVDRTAEEQQAINYAFKNNGEWAILSNFEVLRLFNARRDWLVLAFETPHQYLEDFDLLWQLAYENVIKGSLDDLSNQRVAPNIDSDYLAFINEWRQKLADNLLKRRFTNRWMFDKSGVLKLGELRAVVQQFLDRLVVTRFAEDWLVIRPGTLRQFYDISRTNEYAFTLDEQLDRFFRRFDETHNSALFAPGSVDKANFGDEALLPLVEKLYEVRYRAMPADILGNTYEQYLGKALVLDGDSVVTRDNLETRKKQGSYYTPQVIVRYLVRQSLGRALYGTEDGTPDGKPLADAARQTSFSVRSVRVLDSACGSGSFLIEAYYLLKEFYEAEIARLTAERNRLIDQLARSAGGDTQDMEIEARRLTLEVERLKNYPRIILETHLYGVDLDPQAAEVAVVNLLMRAMERGSGDKRLPLLLNQNVKVGNGLVGLKADDPRMAQHAPALAEMMRLRALLTTDPDKPTDLEALETARRSEAREKSAFIDNEVVREAYEKSLIQTRDLQADRLNKTHDALEALTQTVRDALDAEVAPHFSDLSRVRPFHWGLEFPEVFYHDDGTLREDAGFAVILGNPPWEILKPDLREYYAQFDADIESRLPRAAAETRIAELDAADTTRRAAFEAINTSVEETVAYTRGSGAYTRQGRGDAATHKLFTERMYGLLQQAGRLGYVVPSGIYTDLGTKDLREMLLNEGNIQYIYSFSNERYFFNGVHHSFKFALIGAQKGQQSDGFWATFRFNPRVAVKPDDLTAFLADEKNLIYVKRESIARFSPDSLSLMEFETRRDYDVAEKLYSDHPTIGANLPERWKITLNNEFHFTNDRHLFNQQGEGIPLYEGKMFHQYNAYYAPPQFRIAEDKILKLNEKQKSQLKTYRVVHRRIASATNERTLISAIVPPNTACEVNATVMLVNGEEQERAKLYLCALMNSFVLDYILRYKVSTTLNMFYIYSLPLPRLTAGNPYFDAIVPRAARLTCTRAEYAGLWAEVMGEAWQPSPPNPSPERGVPLGEGSPEESSDSPLPDAVAEGLGVRADGGVRAFPATDPAERQRLRDEIDVLVAKLYGLSRDEFAHILGTFPLVFPAGDVGEARKARLLAGWDMDRLGSE